MTDIREEVAAALHAEFAPIACISDRDMHDFEGCDAKEQWRRTADRFAARGLTVVREGEFTPPDEKALRAALLTALEGTTCFLYDGRQWSHDYLVKAVLDSLRSTRQPEGQ